MAIFRRVPPRARFFPRPRVRYVRSKTPTGIIPGTGSLTITGHAPTVTRGTAPPVYGSLEGRIFVHKVEVPALTFYSGTASMGAAGVSATLIDPGMVTQEAFGSDRTPGLVTASFGDAVYDNTNGLFDLFMIGTPTDGCKVTCYVGQIDGSFPADFSVDYIAYIDGTPKFKRDKDSDTMTLKLRDRSDLFNAQVSTQGFDHALSDAAGTRKRPIAYGTPGYLLPILYLPFELGNVWYVQKNAPADDMEFVYDGGVQLVNQGEASSLSDLFNTTPNKSSYRWFYDDGSSGAENEGTWIRLCTEVHTELRYYAQSATTIVSALAVAAGISDSMDADSFDLEVGSRTIEQQSYADVLGDVAKANLSLIGLDRQDQLFQRYILPSTEEDYNVDFTFDYGTNSTEWEITAPGGLDRRVRELKVNAGATTQGMLAGIPDLDGEAAEAISREQWLTSFVGSSDWVVSDDSGAERVELEIQANHFAGDEDGMLRFAADFFALYGSRQIWYWLTAEYTAETAALNLMDRVALTGERYVSGAPYGRIVSIERHLKERRIRFGVWVHVTSYVVQPEDVELTALDDASTAGVGSATSRGTKNVNLPESVIIKCGNVDTPVDTVGLVQDIPDFPHAVRLAGISAALTTAQTSGTAITIDVRVEDISVFSQTITIENGSVKSSSAASQPVLSAREIAQGESLKVLVDTVGDGTAEGLTVTLTGLIIK